MKRRVVVTSMGAVSPLGNSVNELWNNLLAGKSGIDRITRFDTSPFSCKIGGEIKNLNWQECVSPENLSKAKKLDLFVHYGLAAAKEAVDNLDTDLRSIADRVGLAIGSGIGGLGIQQTSTFNYIQKGPTKITPYYIPGLIGNIFAGFLGIELGVTGPNLAVQTACASANHSMAVSFMTIREGMADIMITGGSEATILELGYSGFCKMHAMTTQYNDEPEKGSRPFDKDRSGFVMSEGAGILVFEEYEHAKARGANILCEVCSIGMTGDAYDLVQPHNEGAGAYKSMKSALDQAGISADEINYINAHGTSTPVGDVAECKAISKLIDNRKNDIYVGSTKSMTGHLLGATSGIEAIACIKAMEDQKIPPNINIDCLDEQIELECINTKPVDQKITYALSNSFGFGGHNSTLCIKKAE